MFFHNETEKVFHSSYQEKMKNRILKRSFVKFHRFSIGFFLISCQVTKNFLFPIRWVKVRKKVIFQKSFFILDRSVPKCGRFSINFKETIFFYELFREFPHWFLFFFWSFGWLPIVMLNFVITIFFVGFFVWTWVVFRWREVRESRYNK